MGRKKTKFIRRFRQALEVPFMHLGLVVLPRLPRWGVLALARGVAVTGYYLSAHSRRLGLANLDLAFGHTKSPAEKRRILQESMRNFMLALLDLVWFTRDSTARMERWFEAAPSMRESMSTRRARVGVTGHFGNWELTGRYWAMKAYGLMSVARPLKNPAVNVLVQQARQNDGQQIIERQGALKRLVRHLRLGGTVGLLLDQNTRLEEGGVFAEFFGKPVAVSPAAGILAPLTGAEVLFGYALPRADGSYLGETPRLITAAEIAAMEREHAAHEITQRINRFYEEAIRNRPECWLWAYKRWRWIPNGVSPEGFPYYAKREGE